MRIFIIGLIFIISPNFCFGHNPLSARYAFQAGENGSLLTINLSQDGVNKVLLQKYGKAEIEKSSQKVFKEMIVDYIKSNFTLSIDNQVIKLNEGGIKLGSHQTDLKFVLPPISRNIEKFTIDIPAFKENENHQTIFSHDLKGENDHVILSSKNDYEVTEILTESEDSISWLWFALIGLLTLISIILLKKRFDSKAVSVSH